MPLIYSAGPNECNGVRMYESSPSSWSKRTRSDRARVSVLLPDVLPQVDVCNRDDHPKSGTTRNLRRRLARTDAPNAISALSMATLSDLSLFQATPAQLLESRQRTHVQWAYGLSIEDYLRRDDLMDKMEHAKDGRLTTWYVPFALIRKESDDGSESQGACAQE
jgi:hypothetical protein